MIMTAAATDTIDAQTKLRVRMGIQCPECYSVDTDKRPEAGHFQCNFCGCQWDRNHFPPEPQRAV
jgi:ribosomal protein L37AE/L43A